MKDSMLERLKEVIAEKSSSILDYSNKIGVPQTTLNNQIKSPRGISINVILLTLDTFPDISAEWLLRGKVLLSDNLPKFHGSETERELDAHAELSRKTAELEELKIQVLRLDAQKEYLQERNDDLIVSCRLLQNELNQYQEPKKKKDIV